MRKSHLIASFFTITTALSFSVVSSVEAASLANLSDKVSTSRPSPSTVITGQYSGGVTVQDNKSRFLASDSARFLPVGGGTLVGPYTVSFQSTDLLNLNFTTNPSALASGTYVATTPITAIHKVQFTTVNSVPSGGDIVISFEGSGVTVASPSATTFSFNGLTTANAASNIATNNATCTWTISAPDLTCDVGSAISAGTTVTVLIGCTAQSGGNCTGGAPRLINPTKSAAAGTADLWKVDVTTKNSSGATLDEGTATIGVIDAVEVQAEVDPTLTFTIAGVNDGTDLSLELASCPADTTNTGFNSTATLVNLGILANGTINKAAQTLSISTNASGGYVISATSSGRFINPSTGYHIPGLNNDTALTANDTPAPVAFGASGTEGFGISPCGARVNTTLWGSTATTFSGGSKYSNPYNSGTNSYYATLASFTGTAGVSLDETIVRYAATVSGLTPAGIYRNNFTYVATATF